LWFIFDGPHINHSERCASVQKPTGCALNRTTGSQSSAHWQQRQNDNQRPIPRRIMNMDYQQKLPFRDVSKYFDAAAAQ